MDKIIDLLSNTPNLTVKIKDNARLIGSIFTPGLSKLTASSIHEANDLV